MNEMNETIFQTEFIYSKIAIDNGSLCWINITYGLSILKQFENS